MAICQEWYGPDEGNEAIIGATVKVSPAGKAKGPPLRPQPQDGSRQPTKAKEHRRARSPSPLDPIVWRINLKRAETAAERGPRTQDNRQLGRAWENGRSQFETHYSNPGGGGTPKKTSTNPQQTKKKTTPRKSGQSIRDRNTYPPNTARAFRAESLGTVSYAGAVTAGQKSGVGDTRTAGVTRWRERSPTDTPDRDQTSVPSTVYHRDRSRTDHIQSFSTYLSTTSIQCRCVINCDQIV